MGINSFGGNPVTPGQQQYAAYTLSDTPLQLNFPNDYSSGVNLFSTYMNITSTADGQIIKMPPGTQSGTGAAADFINIGNFSFDVQDYLGNLLLTMIPQAEEPGVGVSVANFFLIDNSVDGRAAPPIWDMINLGSSNSSAQATYLAGYGLIALAAPDAPARSVLNTNSPVRTEVASFTVDDTYRASVVNVEAAISCFLPNNPVEADGFYFDLINNGNNTLEVSGNGANINGVSNINLAVNDSMRIVSDGTQYFAYNLASIKQTDFNIQSYPGFTGSTLIIPGNVLNGFQAFVFTGTLLSDALILLENIPGAYYISNYTVSGGFSFTVAQNAGGVATGTEYEIPEGGTRIFMNVSATIGGGTPTPGLIQVPDDTVITGVFPYGTMANPSITFANPAGVGTGFYLDPGPPVKLGVSVLSQELMSFSNSGLAQLITIEAPMVVNDTFTANTYLADSNGTLANCAFAFTSSVNTGAFYDPAVSGTLTLAVNGQEIFEATPNDLTVTEPTTFNFPISLTTPLSMTNGGTGTATAPTKVGQSLFSGTTSVGSWGGFAIRQIVPVVNTTFLGLSNAVTTLPLSATIILTATNSRVFIMATINLANTSSSDRPRVNLQQNFNGEGALNILEGVGGFITPTFVIQSNNELNGVPLPYAVTYLTDILAAGTYEYSFSVDATGSSLAIWYNRGENQSIGGTPGFSTPSTLYLVEIGGF